MKFRAIPMLCVCAVAGPGILAQKIEIAPATVLIDEAPSIRVTGVAPGASVTVEADLSDGNGKPWHSEAQFAADAQGGVDLAAQAPAKGSYREASAMGLVWSMRPAEHDVHFFAPPHDSEEQTVHFQLLYGGKEVGSADLVQRYVAAGVRTVRVEGALHGTLFLPPEAGRGDTKVPGVLVVGGSEGGLPRARAAWLASHGCAALALAYFHYEDLPATLRDIPLEYFGRALAWMAQRPEIDAKRLGVMGTSRGGELALQLGSMYPEIHAVVAYVPANIRVASCCGRPFGAAWTWHGEGLAWALPGMPNNPATLMRATIAVEGIHGPVLMIGGESDGVWSSSEMVQAAASRLRQAHFGYPVVTLTYAHAGHRAGMPEILPTWNNGVLHPLTGRLTDLGGTPEGNAESTLDAIPKVLDFLRTSLAADAAAPVTEGRAPGATRR
ncbi:MAG TPA: acyl-CoA thioesterase/bile acid-CoA:amino acid N-acyltransferase family protein [Acidobacteriaceae bacterium]